MAPRHSISNSASDSSDDENDAPEAVSLNQSKKEIQKLESDVKTAALTQKLNKKRQNQERDKKLKERAEANKDKQVKGKAVAKKSQKGKEESEDSDNDFGSEGESGSEDELQARMRRAMQEAAEEDSDASDEEEGGEGEAWGGIGEEGGSAGSDEEEDDDSQTFDDENSEDEEDEFDEEEAFDEDTDEEEEEEVFIQRKPLRGKSNPDHLPEELFAAAFASSAQEKAPSKPKRKASEREQQTTSRPGKKRKPNTPRDIAIGKSTAIRLLPNTASKPPIPLAMPSKKINHFLDRSLALKGGKQRNKGWERRPANIGVLRQNGPAAHFVRS